MLGADVLREKAHFLLYSQPDVKFYVVNSHLAPQGGHHNYSRSFLCCQITDFFAVELVIKPF